MRSSFAKVFKVERDTLRSEPPDPATTYRADHFPSTPNATRQWTTHPEWVDGHLCDMPRGPAPSAGETQYVYRSINSAKAVTARLAFRVRAPEDSWQPEWEHYWPERDPSRALMKLLVLRGSG